MCSICGGTIFDDKAKRIWELSIDRGRDSHGLLTMDGLFWIGNHRAIPTTEVQVPIEEQPVGQEPKIVFNGTIANDAELGVHGGEADTSVLPRVLDFTNLEAFRDSLYKIKGSFALAVLFKDGNIWLACNYKPIWWAKQNNQFYFSSLQHHLENMYSQRVPPYSVMHLQTGKILPIERYQSNKAIVICSGGLDSTAVAAYAGQQHDIIHLLHYDYGCLASENEKRRVQEIAEYLECSFEIIKLPTIFFGNKSIMQSDPNKIADGKAGAEYAHEWVPARNLVMLANTVAYAEAYDYGHIYLGTNLEESSGYPDNEEQFILDFNNLLYGAVQNGIKIEIHTPLGGLMKHEIVKFGNSWDAPFDLTWSCYKNGEKHCGKCGPCFMRRTAFERNGLIDPVLYER